MLVRAPDVRRRRREFEYLSGDQRRRQDRISVESRVQLLLSPQGDIALTDNEEVGTSNAWVWPFTTGVRIGLPSALPSQP